MPDNQIAHFLTEQRESAPDSLQPLLLECEDFWERKLWHQLTSTLIQFFNHPESVPLRLSFYKTFVLKFANNINQLKLVEIALKTVTQCKDDHSRLSFLLAVAERVDKQQSQDALVYASVSVARVRLSLDDVEGSRKDLDSAEKLLDTFNSVETVVHAAFYDANASYFQRIADFAAYYHNALLYLACIEVESLTPEERRLRAYHLSIAALVSKSIYNFGELLMHPILDALTGDDLWLRDLLFAFNRGDLVAFERVSGHITAHELLSQHVKHLHQKIYLSALTEAVSRRPPHDRAVTFTDVAQETRIGIDEIEHLIMKALSLGLLRGTIDQVDGIANITWVQPKVLDKVQVQNLRERLLEWESSVNQLGNWIETAGKDVWAA